MTIPSPVPEPLGAYSFFSKMRSTTELKTFDDNFELLKNALDEMSDEKRIPAIKAMVSLLKEDLTDKRFTTFLYIELKANLIRVIDNLEMRLSENTNSIPPIKWTGTIEEWGRIMECIAEAGYIEHKRNSEGMIYNSLAQILQPHFTFGKINPKLDRLADQINPYRRNKEFENKFTASTLKIPARG